MKQETKDACKTAFWGAQCYLDEARHAIVSAPQVRALGLDPEGLTALPHYSMAWVCREYVERVKSMNAQTAAAYDRYQLGRPAYAFDPVGDSAYDEEYISKAHCFCEDCGLEDGF